MLLHSILLITSHDLRGKGHRINPPKKLDCRFHHLSQKVGIRIGVTKQANLYINDLYIHKS